MSITPIKAPAEGPTAFEEDNPTSKRNGPPTKAGHHALKE
jgi:hypothetical protein